MNRCILLFTVLLAGCTTQAQREQQMELYLQSLVTRCIQMGYVEEQEGRACVRRLHNANQAQPPQNDDYINAVAESMRRSRPIETTCSRPDALGAVRCTSR